MDTNSILSITKGSKKFDIETFEVVRDSFNFSRKEYYINPYYNTFNRPFFALEELSLGSINNYRNIANDSVLKITQKQLNTLQQIISKSNFLEVPDEGYEDRGNRYKTQIIQFTTLNDNEHEDEYFYMSMNSGEVSNDHYPLYEFLIHNNKLIKKQKFFYDFAGVEGMEYPTIAPTLELFVILVLVFLVGIYKGFRLLFTKHTYI